MPVRRRKYSRAAAGASAGFDSVSKMLSYMLQRNYQQEITQENARAQQKINQENAEDNDTRARARTRDELISKGELDPDQDVGDVPTMARRISGITSGIEGAASPEQLPTISGLTSQAKAKRVPEIGFGVTNTFTPEETKESGNLPSTQRGPTSTPEFDRLLHAREQKADQFRKATPPTTRSQISADGIKEEQDVQFNPIAGLLQPLPGAARPQERTGEQEGQRSRAQWEADQGSPERVERTIDIANQTERGTRQEKITTSADTASATTVAEINARHRNAQKLADIAYQQSVATNRANLEFIPADVQAREYATGQQRVNKATNDALRALAQVSALFEAAKKSMPSTTAGGIAMTGVEQYLPGGRLILPADVRRYLEQIDVLRPEIARLNGEVGNLNITEQERAGLVWPTIMDVAQGTADDKLVRFEAFASMSAKIYELTAPGQPLANSPQRAEIIKQMLDLRVKQLKGQTIEFRGLPYTIVDVTKDGPVLQGR